MDSEAVVVGAVVGCMAGMLLGWLAPAWLSATIIMVLIYWYAPKPESWAQDSIYSDTVIAMNRRW